MNVERAAEKEFDGTAAAHGLLVAVFIANPSASASDGNLSDVDVGAAAEFKGHSIGPAPALNIDGVVVPAERISGLKIADILV